MVTIPWSMVRFGPRYTVFLFHFWLHQITLKSSLLWIILHLILTSRWFIFKAADMLIYRQHYENGVLRQWLHCTCLEAFRIIWRFRNTRGGWGWFERPSGLPPCSSSTHCYSYVSPCLSDPSSQSDDELGTEQIDTLHLCMISSISH